MEQIVMVMRRKMLEWFGQVKRRGGIENTRAVDERKMNGGLRGRHMMRWKETGRKDIKAWDIREE